MSPDRIDALTSHFDDTCSRRGALIAFGIGVAGPAATAFALQDALAKRRKNKKPKKKPGIKPVDTLVGIPVRAHGRGRNFKGTLDITEFVEGEDGGIVAVGELTGKLTGKRIGNRKISETVELPVTLPDVTATRRVQAQQLTCEVLHLELGPITLNLLGLNVYIGGPNNTPLIVDITADPSGGLLGQLLCALAGGGPLAQIIGLLNQILAILQGL
jgi:hypothetical protein